MAWGGPAAPLHARRSPRPHGHNHGGTAGPCVSLAQCTAPCLPRSIPRPCFFAMAWGGPAVPLHARRSQSLTGTPKGAGGGTAGPCMRLHGPPLAVCPAAFLGPCLFAAGRPCSAITREAFAQASRAHQRGTEVVHGRILSHERNSTAGPCMALAHCTAISLPRSIPRPCFFAMDGPAAPPLAHLGGRQGARAMHP
jgi:hypothetical protein